MADRYTYIPLIGIFIAIVWGIFDLTRKWHYQNIILIVASAIILTFFSIITWFQIGFWKNSISIWTHVIECMPDNYLAYYNRGVSYQDLNHLEKAIADYDMAIKLNPNDIKAYYNRGSAYQMTHHPEKAISDYTTVIHLKPDETMFDVFFNRGLLNYKLASSKEKATERLKTASRDLEVALRLMPRDWMYRLNAEKLLYFSRKKLEQFKP